MKNFKQARLSVITAAILGLAGAAMLPVSVYADTPAADAAATTEILRPEIKAILTAAKELNDAKKPSEAIAKLAETDAVANKTPYEIFAIDRTRADYYYASGDKANAAKAFEAVVATNYLPKASQLNLFEALGQLYFQLSDYPSTIKWLERYVKEGGPDPKGHEVLNNAYYLNKNFAEAYNGVDSQVQADIAAGKVPAEQSFRILASCKSELKDDAGLLKSIELWNTYYPNAKNWLYLLGQVHFKPGFSDRMYLDIFRLKTDLSLMKTGAEYLDMADLAGRAALPAEAKKALDQGFAAGVLGKGADAKKHESLLAAANKHADEDLKSLDQGEVSANKSKDGNGLINLGMAFATAGQLDKGASLIEQGIAKGGLTKPEEAKLHLGVVYYWAGKKDAAIKQLQTVTGTDGTGDLARYWIMQINHPLAK